MFLKPKIPWILKTQELSEWLFRGVVYEDDLMAFVNIGHWSTGEEIVVRENRSDDGSGLLQMEEGM